VEPDNEPDDKPDEEPDDEPDEEPDDEPDDEPDNEPDELDRPWSWVLCKLDWNGGRLHTYVQCAVWRVAMRRDKRSDLQRVVPCKLAV
jgi:hypothetical protein